MVASRLKGSSGIGELNLEGQYGRMVHVLVCRVNEDSELSQQHQRVHRVLFIDFVSSSLQWPMGPLSESLSAVAEIRSIDPLKEAVAPDGYRTLTEQAVVWTSALGRQWIPDLIVCYCNGAALAVALRERWETRTRVVALEPAVFSRSDLVNLAAALLRFQAGDNDLDFLRVDTLDPDAAVSAMRVALLTAAQRQHPNLDDFYLEQLVAMQIAWFSFAVSITMVAGPQELDLVISSTNTEVPDFLPLERVIVAVPTGELSRAEETALIIKRWRLG